MAQQDTARGLWPALAPRTGPASTLRLNGRGEGARRALWVALGMLALAGCRSGRSEVLPSGDTDLLGEGLASYYGAELHGRRTASGERFDKDALTAAHRTLPFGQCVVVQNARNGRTTRVRINDRGPFVAGRVIDVSEGAARELGLLQAGVVRVRVYRCSPGR